MKDLVLLILLTCANADNCVSGEYNGKQWIAMNRAGEVSNEFRATMYLLKPKDSGVLILGMEKGKGEEDER